MNYSIEDNEHKVSIVSGRNTYHLAEKIATKCGVKLANVSVTQFSDGEIQPVIEDDMRSSYVYIIQSTNYPAENFHELLMLIDAAKRASAKSIVAIIPYFGYSRQNHLDRPGIPITAKLHARLLSAAGVNQIITLDLHSIQVERFFDVPIVHLQPTELFCSYIKSLGLDSLTFGAKDFRSSARATQYASFFNTDFAIVDKNKPRDFVEQKSIIGDVNGRNVILVDDIIDTAHSICIAARIIMDHGAVSVKAVVTHPLLSGEAYEYIERSDLEEVVVTDSIPIKKYCPKIKVLSTAEIFAKVINSQV